jgi:putative aminopeptidase FrvX
VCVFNQSGRKRVCAHRLDTRIGIGVGIGIGTRVGVEIGVGTLFVFNREENAGTVVIPRACGITCTHHTTGQLST